MFVLGAISKTFVIALLSKKWSIQSLVCLLEKDEELING